MKSVNNGKNNSIFSINAIKLCKQTKNVKIYKDKKMLLINYTLQRNCMIAFNGYDISWIPEGRKNTLCFDKILPKTCKQTHPTKLSPFHPYDWPNYSKKYLRCPGKKMLLDKEKNGRAREVIKKNDNVLR